MRRDPIGRSPRRDCGLQKELGLFPRLPSKSREILEGLDQPPTLHAEKIAEETPEREDRLSIRAVLEDIWVIYARTSKILFGSKLWICLT